MEPTIEETFSEIERRVLGTAKAGRDAKNFRKGKVRTNKILKILGTKKRTVLYSELTNAEVYHLERALIEPNFIKQTAGDLTHSFLSETLSYRTNVAKPVFVQGSNFADVFNELDSYLRDLSADIANIYIEKAKRDAAISIDDEPTTENTEDEVKKARFRNPIRRIKP